MVLISKSLIRSLENAEVSMWSLYLTGLAAGDYQTTIRKLGETTVLKAEKMNSLLMNRVKNFSSDDIEYFDDIITLYKNTNTSFVFDLVPDLIETSSDLYSKLLEIGAKPVIHYTLHINDLDRLNQQRIGSDDYSIIRPSSIGEFADTFVRGFGMDEERQKKTKPLQELGWSHSDLEKFILFHNDTHQNVATGVIHCSNENIGVLGGATTVPEFRGNGYQQALIQHRLHYANKQGMNYVISDATSGGTSSRNLQRQGFSIAYSRTYWRVSFE